MDPQQIQEVTIVGGGTAGWLTAACLNAKLNATSQRPRVRVVLIESPNVPIIGVGEGTLPSMINFLKQIGIGEAEFFRECNASFKFGVRFDGWNVDERGAPYSFVHPFGSVGQDLGGINPIYHFLAFGAHPGRQRYDAGDNLTAGTELIRLCRAPRRPSDEAFSHIVPARYGYHLDAPKLAEFLRKFSVARGVTHILDDVDEATVDENGHISHLQLRRQGVRPVELVVDCTGFQSRLIGKVLGEPFGPYDRYLLCDRAIPIQIPHPEGQPRQVCTSATAMSAGWLWKVPLYSRMGTGYVYSSAFCSDDEAAREICAHLGLDPDQVAPRVIRMRVGQMRRAWVGNCIAIGLSGGFIEPLEATAIMIITFAANQLVKNFPTKPVPSALADRFNERVSACYDRVRDFIVLHYYAANRPEPFWLAARSPSVLPDTLARNLAVWRHRLPEEDDLPHRLVFSAYSYSVCLASKGYFKGSSLPARLTPSRERWVAYGQHLERQRGAVRSMPTARQLLARLRGEIGSEAPGAAPRSQMTAPAQPAAD